MLRSAAKGCGMSREGAYRSVMMDSTKIRAWGSGKDFCVALHHITKRFPADERFGFTSQMRRAARSTCANVAEGSGYTGNRDSAQDFHELEGLLIPTRKQVYQL